MQFSERTEKNICTDREHSVCQYPNLLFLLNNKSSILFRATMHPVTFSCFPGNLSFGSLHLPKRREYIVCLCLAAWNLAVMVRALAAVLDYKDQGHTYRWQSKELKKAQVHDNFMKLPYLTETVYFKNYFTWENKYCVFKPSLSCLFSFLPNYLPSDRLKIFISFLQMRRLRSKEVRWLAQYQINKEVGLGSELNALSLKTGLLMGSKCKKKKKR